MKNVYLFSTMIASVTILLLIAGCGGGHEQSQTGSSEQDRNSTDPAAKVLGQALAGLNSEEQQLFDEGLASFTKVETADDGLGPVFNGTSCTECHKVGAAGGAGPDLTISRVTRIGGLHNGAYSDLEEVGGPVLQARSLREFDATYPVPGEVVPVEAKFVSHRIATPLFGAGLIEAIPEATLLARAQQADSDGVRGVANRVFNPETGRTEIGRFGWKAQHSSLHLFAGDAYLNEMGVTSDSFPKDNLPQGKPIPAGADSVSDPEDKDGDSAVFTAFMRFLAPPARQEATSTLVTAGATVFQSVRCVACHVPEMNTGANASAALANKPVRLYSDLLLHRMGPGLADGIQQGVSDGEQFRTAPLWGLRLRKFYLHDGRAATIESAILAHDGEAQPARRRFQNLSAQQRTSLLAFLNSL